MGHKYSNLLLTALIVFAQSSKAQYAPLEDANDDPTTARTRARLRETQPQSVSATALPEDEMDKEYLSKAYESVMAHLRTNDVPGAQVVMQKYDIITKQKILKRMIEEAPEATAATGDDTDRAPAAQPSEESPAAAPASNDEASEPAASAPASAPENN